MAEWGVIGASADGWKLIDEWSVNNAEPNVDGVIYSGNVGDNALIGYDKCKITIEGTVKSTLTLSAYYAMGWIVHKAFSITLPTINNTMSPKTVQVSGECTRSIATTISGYDEAISTSVVLVPQAEGNGLPSNYNSVRLSKGNSAIRSIFDLEIKLYVK